MIEDLKRKYIIDWIVWDIRYELKEDFRRGMLHSDRKWYDVIITIKYLWEEYNSMFSVQPREMWTSILDGKIEKQKQKAIYNIANIIYSTMFK